MDDLSSAALPGDLGRYCGDYGWPHEIMRIYGSDGGLACRVEWFFEYRLERAGGSTFVMPGYGLYPGEKLEFVEEADGSVTGARLGGVLFPRL